MSLYDSPLSNAHTRRLALYTLSAVAFVPAYAKDLMQRAGMSSAISVITPLNPLSGPGSFQFWEFIVAVITHPGQQHMARNVASSQYLSSAAHEYLSL